MAPLDEKGEISLGVRAYTAARVATENTDVEICYGEGNNFKCGGSNGLPPTPLQRQTLRSLTFPVSAAGHLRHNRFYVEAELEHNLQRLVSEGFGPFALLNDLPFKFRKFKYHPDVPWRGRRHLRLRTGRVPDRVSVLQQAPGAGLLRPHRGLSAAAPAFAPTVGAPRAPLPGVPRNAGREAVHPLRSPDPLVG